MDQFGPLIRARRRALNTPIREVAKAIGRATSHVSNIERGHIPGSHSDRTRIEAYLIERERQQPALRAVAKIVRRQLAPS